VHGHQVPLYLAFDDFTYTLEPSLPQDNHAIALEQQGATLEHLSEQEEKRELCLGRTCRSLQMQGEGHVELARLSYTPV
jgi:hypothetical protein